MSQTGIFVPLLLSSGESMGHGLEDMIGAGIMVVGVGPGASGGGET